MNIIDKQELMEHLEGDMELLQDAYEIFCEDVPRVKTDLQTAFTSGDRESVRSTAHTLSGLLSNFHAAAACETARKIEHHEDLGQASDVQALLDQLEAQISSMHSEIKQILQSAGQ